MMAETQSDCRCPDSWALECVEGRLIESLETESATAGGDLGPCECPTCHADGTIHSRSYPGVSSE